MMKDFLSSSVYSPSTQFFNLCVSWNINGWNDEKRDGIRYFNEIFKPICICLQEVGNSQYLNAHSNNYPFLCHYNTILRKADPNIPGMRGLRISVHRSLFIFSWSFLNIKVYHFCQHYFFFGELNALLVIFNGHS